MSRTEENLSAARAVVKQSRQPKPASSKANQRSRNPLQSAVLGFLTEFVSEKNSLQPIENRHSLATSLVGNVRELPKRYTLYHPLLLLPLNFLPPSCQLLQSRPTKPSGPGSAPDTRWHDFVGTLDETEFKCLWARIAKAFSRHGVTHIAIGAPIELEIPGNDSLSKGSENTLRSPTGITGVYGDLGLLPAGNRYSGTGENSDWPSLFDKALWVSTIQNNGIVQVWAPMFTMFSRGNIKEKARILSGVAPVQTNQHARDIPFGADSSPSRQISHTIFPGLDDTPGELSQPPSAISVVDLYIGIGYFAFSYLKRGVGLVWGFELNAWSVEGLRRGAEQNGWVCDVIRLPAFPLGDPPLNSESGIDKAIGQRDMEKIIAALENPQVRLLVFHADNRWASTLLPLIRAKFQVDQSWRPCRHVNLGLLPTSRGSWSDACELLLHQGPGPSSQLGGWTHIHENVETEKIPMKAEEIRRAFEKFVHEHHQMERKGGEVDVTKHGKDKERDRVGDAGWQVECVHVERVKMYAPGIWHCVFDIWIHR